METTFPCPHCKKPVPDHVVDEQNRRKSFCPHCSAPIKFRFLNSIVGYFAGLLVGMAVMAATKPLWVSFIVFDSHDKLDRDNIHNLVFVLPFLIIMALVERWAHRRFCTLVLANAKWPLRLSVAERKLMREHDIVCNGEYFACGEMHFDNLAEAVSFSLSLKAKTTV